MTSPSCGCELTRYERLASRGEMPCRIGSAAAGALLQTVGPISTVLIFGAVLFLIALAATLNGHIRRAEAVV